MKKVLIGILIVSLIFAFCGCSKERTDISDYQYMYDGIVVDWNKQATPGHERETLLGFGEYLYNSQLIFFPRETPSTLNEFYFHWTPSIDVDGYAIYFLVTLSGIVMLVRPIQSVNAELPILVLRRWPCSRRC